jgi:hypothetical protein
MAENISALSGVTLLYGHFHIIVVHCERLFSRPFRRCRCTKYSGLTYMFKLRGSFTDFISIIRIIELSGREVMKIMKIQTNIY